MNTVQLIQRCQAGDEAAIQTLIDEHQPRLFRLALSILDDAAEADEATQDVFVAALKALHTYRAEAQLTTWLYTIAVNVCRSRLRRRRSWERLIERVAGLFSNQGAQPEEITLQNETQRAVWQAVQALDEKHRLPVILRYYHDLAVPEIARILEISEGTVHSRLFTARERLRGALSGLKDSPTPRPVDRLEI